MVINLFRTCLVTACVWKTCPLLTNTVIASCEAVLCLLSKYVTRNPSQICCLLVRENVFVLLTHDRIMSIFRRLPHNTTFHLLTICSRDLLCEYQLTQLMFCARIDFYRCWVNKCFKKKKKKNNVTQSVHWVAHRSAHPCNCISIGKDREDSVHSSI